MPVPADVSVVFFCGIALFLGFVVLIWDSKYDVY